jgi:hypothetical protein
MNSHSLEPSGNQLVSSLACVLPPATLSPTDAAPMPRNCGNRPVRLQHPLALCATLILSACASHYSQVPARLELAPYGRVALVTFTADQPNPGISSLATQRFAEALLASQTGFELLELGGADSLLKNLSPNTDAVALAQALGKQKNVPAVFVGFLKISNMKPSGHIDGSGMNVRAGVSAELTVRLLSTSTGGTVWRSSGAANGTVGRIDITDRLPSFAIRDKDEAYGEVVSDLVAQVTRDLRPTWIKR